MHHALLLRQVDLLEGPGTAPQRVDALVHGQRLLLWAPRLTAEQVETALAAQPPAQLRELGAEGWLLAPPLVDPHSVLEEPLLGRAETLASLAAAAASGGYGTVALLPWARPWRDRPERLQLSAAGGLRLELWGSFSLEGEERELAPHADQLEAGAVGLAGGDGLPPLAALERGLRLGEIGERPLLLAPRDSAFSQQGVLRERVEALRVGLPLDPVLSETLPLQSLLTLAEAHPQARIRLMNLSTAEAVALLRRSAAPPPASVCWWHLLADSGSLDPAGEGWRMIPSLGGPDDREALLEAVAEGLISAVAIHHRPLDAEEQVLPLDQRRAGLAGHGLALSLLWRELVQARGWSVELLWQRLSWGPSRFLERPIETLSRGGDRWLLFDPEHAWSWGPETCPSLAANQPVWRQELRGAVLASGFSDPGCWRLVAAPGPKSPPH